MPVLSSTEFLEESRIATILNKYCKFLPVEIKFGIKTDKVDDPKGRKDDKGNIIKIDKVLDNIINNTKSCSRSISHSPACHYAVVR
jgi:molecular chaperone HtpG